MTQHPNNRLIRPVVLLMATPALLFAACASAPTDRDTFDTPQAAVEATIGALRNDEVDRIHAIFGPESLDLMDSGDEVYDRQNRMDFVALYDEAHMLEKEDADFYVLNVGAIESPFAIPLVEAGGKWYWDTEEGREELIDRRIGRNELDTIQVCQAIVDAQMEYADIDRDGDGFKAYATRFRSSPGKKDGLYWPTAEGEEPSPLGELIVDAEAEGYGDPSKPANEPTEYHGYAYRILYGQGEDAPGGEYSYIVDGKMIGGFAILAFPTEYGDSGIMTFQVNHDGVVYEKDLGEKTHEIAKAMSLFDPDDWEKSDLDPE